MRGTVVGVLRGGPSREHENSLRSGHAVLGNLSPERYTVRDIYIDKEGVWYVRGLATTPGVALSGIDVALIALHGEYGEDGEIQKLLERFGTPYAGSNSFASFVAMHKVLANGKAREAGLQTPRYYFVENEADIDAKVFEAVRTLPQPVVVRPVLWGSSVGTTLQAGYQPVHSAVTGLFNSGAQAVLIEENVRGTNASVGVVENFRDSELYTLPVVEVTPTAEMCPGSFKKPVAEELQDAARRMHQALGLRHYSHSDFKVTPRGIYYQGTSTLPGLTPDSTFPKSLAAIGITYPDFLTHLIGLALAGRKR